MDSFVKPLTEIQEFTDTIRSLKEYNHPLSISGPSDSQKVHMAFSICENLKFKGIYIAHNEIQARKVYEDFLFFLGEQVVLFPTKELILYDIKAKSSDALFQRLKALEQIIEGDFKFVVTSAEAIMHKLTQREYFISKFLTLSLGGKIIMADFPLKLVTMGYERVTVVEGKGQFSIRGGIIDIYPVNREKAIRIELFDDEIDSIREFDITSQRSIEKLNSIKILPACEIIFPLESVDKYSNNVQMDLERHIKKINGKCDAEYINNLKSKIHSNIDIIKNQSCYTGIDKYIPYIIENPSNIFEYVAGYGQDINSTKMVLFIDEPKRVKQRIENIHLEHTETCKVLMEKGQMLPKSIESFFGYGILKSQFEKSRVVNLNTIVVEDEWGKKGKNFRISSKSMSSYNGHVELLIDDIALLKQNEYRIVVLSGTKGRGERLYETLRSKEIEAVYVDRINTELKHSQVLITHGSLNKGFEYPSIKLAIISDTEVFGQDRRIKKTSSKKVGSKIKVFTDLNPGDYVVHQAHGIGQYIGIEKLVVESVKKDYLKIRYVEGDYLYIPTSQLDLIQKYIGSEGRTPKLNRLGGADWAKAKRRVKESLRELASELVKLYAERQAVKGFAFSRDTVWQRQLEELFPYEETDDQLKCIDEIKADMEIEKPMDRLLCGDVGYGKTEVAIRAIFKAVMDGKQVAYLVPTTILAQQQYNSLKERLKDFPVTVDVLSRFRSAAEQKSILKEIKSGRIDVLIGTHRLIQKDIRFKDLGLLVVDEEQRFGVTHKEKLKKLKPNVDTLTLTATPIPRTLHMSLSGIRDISIIEDPPEERYPVQTYVMEYNPDVIRDAIIREMARSGQVFFLYNRVRTIQQKASEIQMLVPDARIAIAHGQMDEKQLEDIMLNFINREYDILICTTIIESGLDMPNVNTIIVEDADKMGLSQLYQLRGRVGRSNRLAYAYITYKKDRILTEIAEKRLQAIKEFTDFGSGFKIAMRDLEIRGAGNLLGPEQHGHMESVGYDMYCKLLDEAVRELKGEELLDEDTELSIDLNISAYIDDDYISSENQKIGMYKKIASIQEKQDVMDVEDELIDRYGDIPKPVSNLIYIAYLKTLAKTCGFSSIQEKGDNIVFIYKSLAEIDIGIVSKLMEKHRKKLIFSAGTMPYLSYRTTHISRNELIPNITVLFQEIIELKYEKR